MELLKTRLKRELEQFGKAVEKAKNDSKDGKITADHFMKIYGDHITMVDYWDTVISTGK